MLRVRRAGSELDLKGSVPEAELAVFLSVEEPVRRPASNLRGSTGEKSCGK